MVLIDLRKVFVHGHPKLAIFCQNRANGTAKSEDPDQTAPLEQSDLGLHCLPRPICPKT